jgi:D-alanyl-D-alanine carboxypeptidase
MDAKKLGITWNEEEKQIVNHNLFLNMYEGALGVKNGFTHESRYTLVGAVRRDGVELLAVLLKSDSAKTAYQDMIKLMDFGYTAYATQHADNHNEQEQEEQLESVHVSQDSNSELIYERKQPELPKQPVLPNTTRATSSTPAKETNAYVFIIIASITLLFGFFLFWKRSIAQSAYTKKISNRN